MASSSSSSKEAPTTEATTATEVLHQSPPSKSPESAKSAKILQWLAMNEAQFESHGQDLDLKMAGDLTLSGSKAFQDSDFTEAYTCFGRALNIRINYYGESAPECVGAYFRYGHAVLKRALIPIKDDPLPTVPKEADYHKQSNEDGTISGTKQEKNLIHGCRDPVATREQRRKKLEIASTLFDVAWSIEEKQPGDSIQKACILSALGEVALLEANFHDSLKYYMQALPIFERLVEPDDQRIAYLYFNICQSHDGYSMTEEAITYCEKALSVCKTRLQRLMDELKSSSGSASTLTSIDLNQEPSSLPSVDSSILEKEAEIKTLFAHSSQFERKLQDLKQPRISTPNSTTSGTLKVTSTEAMSSEKSSLRMNTTNYYGGFELDSPTAATDRTNVTGGAVVGTGAKGQFPIDSASAESTPTKKPSLDSSAKKGEGSTS